MIELKMGQVLMAEKIFSKFANQNMRSGPAYKIYRIGIALEKEGQFFREQLQKILEENAQKNEDGSLKFDEGQQNILIDPNRMTETEEKINELYDINVTLDVSKIKLEDIEEIDLTPVEFHTLFPFLIEE